LLDIGSFPLLLFLFGWGGVPASLPAGSAIQKSILAKTYAELALAGAAIFLA